MYMCNVSVLTWTTVLLLNLKFRFHEDENDPADFSGTQQARYNNERI